MFTNSLLAGGLGAAYLTVLVLQLNPHVPLLSATTLRWFATLAVFYGLHLAVVFYVVIVAREFFSMDALSPGWASVRVLAWLSASGAGIAAAMMWLNAAGYQAALGDMAARRMRAGALATSASAAALLGIALAHYSSRRRGSPVGGMLVALAAFGSLTLPLAARGGAAAVSAAPPPSTVAAAASTTVETSARVVLLLLDGASLEYIRTKAAERRLPHFSRILQGGASLYLATIRPTQPGPVWAAAATGMYPAKNGVRSAALYYARGDTRPIFVLPDHCFCHALVQFGAVRSEDGSSAAWQVPPLWRILSNAGVRTGIVRWPLTYPAPPVNGFVVTDRLHEVPGPMTEFDGRAAYPPHVLADAPIAWPAENGAGRAGGPVESIGVSAGRDAFYSRALHALRAASHPQVAALRLQAIDAAGHRYHDDDPPSAFGSEGDLERRTRAQHLERAYADVDAEIGALVDSLAPDDLLLVVSGFGMQRVAAGKELLARALREPVMRGTHERAPDGFLLAYGSAVQPGRLPRGSIVDLTPTVLYFLGIPIGRDMDGFARTDLFTNAFTAERPIAFIATHGGG
jgi:hypothetical protein